MKKKTILGTAILWVLSGISSVIVTGQAGKGSGMVIDSIAQSGKGSGILIDSIGPALLLSLVLAAVISLAVVLAIKRRK
ncbi:MAG: hypothetical protein ACFFD4_19485 [Candidatus Odinarchaeota archaeon]